MTNPKEVSFGSEARSKPPYLSAIDVVTGQHREIQKLFQKLDSAVTPEETTRALEQLSARLVYFTNIEERHLFPAVHSQGGEKGRLYIAEAMDDHDIIRQDIENLRATTPASERWLRLVTQLKENTQHHIEEENSGLLPLAEQLLSEESLLQLGTKMLEE